jgi:hypothetical protein
LQEAILMPNQQRKIILELKTEFYLTGESIIKAATISAPPTSKKPVTVRVTHMNDHCSVDSDIIVRIGDPKAPLIEDWLWNDAHYGWVPSGEEC